MLKSNLQRFAEAISGKKIVYLYRVLEDAKNSAGAALAFTTENSRTKNKDADTTSTKDGTVRTPKNTEVEISATSILSVGDELIDTLETAMDNDKLIEIWEVNLAEEGSTSGKYKATYYQGYLTEVEVSSPADDNVEVSLSFGINGAGVDGEATMSAAQIEAATYSFSDTTKQSE